MKIIFNCPDLDSWHQCRDVEVVHDCAIKKKAGNGINSIKGIVRKYRS
jgi:hypothetical protein